MSDSLILLSASYSKKLFHVLHLVSPTFIKPYSRLGFGLFTLARLFAGSLEFRQNFLCINTLRCHQLIQGLAGFLQRRQVGFGLAVSWNEIANGLTMARHRHRRVGGDEFRQI